MVLSGTRRELRLDLGDGLSNLKTAMSGTYHAVKSAKYAHRRIAEVQYRFNRRFDLRSIFGQVVRVAAVTGQHSRVLIRVAEVGCKS